MHLTSVNYEPHRARKHISKLRQAIKLGAREYLVNPSLLALEQVTVWELDRVAARFGRIVAMAIRVGGEITGTRAMTFPPKTRPWWPWSNNWRKAVIGKSERRKSCVFHYGVRWHRSGGPESGPN